VAPPRSHPLAISEGGSALLPPGVRNARNDFEVRFEQSDRSAESFTEALFTVALISMLIFDMAGINTVMLHRLESREPSNILQLGDEDLTPSGLLLENISSRRRRSICKQDRTTAERRIRRRALINCSIPVNTFRSTVELRVEAMTLPLSRHRYPS